MLEIFQDKGYGIIWLEENKERVTSNEEADSDKYKMNAGIHECIKPWYRYLNVCEQKGTGKDLRSGI